jgi:hypothetical protein
MSKNKDQHFVPAFYLYNFTNDSQKARNVGCKRDTSIFHVDFSSGCVKERSIKKVAIDAYTLSFKDKGGTYNHSLDNEIQKIEDRASRAIEELNANLNSILKKKPQSIRLSNDIIENIFELLFWQIKRHPEIVGEIEK